MAINDGGPAFPIPPREASWKVTMPDGSEQYQACIGHHSGMSLRDFFAATALNGLMGSPEKLINGKNVGMSWPEITEVAYAAADAMIAQRLKGK